MLENLEQKRPVKFKSMFRQQIDTKQATFGRKSSAHLEISPPILQHSTSIFSLVSPTRTGFHTFYNDRNENETFYELYQPSSPPPPIPQQRCPYSSVRIVTNSAPILTTSITNSVSSSPSHHSATANSDPRQTFERLMHPLEISQQQDVKSTSNPIHYADARRTVPSNPRKAVDYRYQDGKKKSNRRHSCSSTMYKLTEKETNNNSNSNRPILREGRLSSKVGTWSPSAASIDPCASKPTPHKIKTYNVPKKIEDIEKLRKIQELEDLITGRRGSTLKLSLTPKGLS